MNDDPEGEYKKEKKEIGKLLLKSFYGFNWRMNHPFYSTFYMRNWRIKKALQGLCQVCGKYPVAVGRSVCSCENCLDKDIQRHGFKYWNDGGLF